MCWVSDPGQSYVNPSMIIDIEVDFCCDVMPLELKVENEKQALFVEFIRILSSRSKSIDSKTRDSRCCETIVM